MSDQVIKELENEFTKTHCTDAVHKQIVSELSTRKKGEKRGQKIELTTRKLYDFLYYVSMGCDYKEAADISLMGENNRKDYAQRSNLFSYVSSLAKTFLPIQLKVGMAKAALGTRPGFYQLKHPVTGNVEYITVKETPANQATAQYLADKHKIFGEDPQSAPGGVVTMPIPTTPEQEAAVMRLFEFWHKITNGKPTTANTS